MGSKIFSSLRAVIACAFGMATKEVMATAPVLVLLYDRTFIAGSFAEAWRQRRKLYAGLTATWLLLAVLLVGVHERGIGYTAVTWWQYALTECSAILHYLRLALWPSPLVFDYGSHVTSRAVENWPQALIVSSCSPRIRSIRARRRQASSTQSLHGLRVNERSPSFAS